MTQTPADQSVPNTMQGTEHLFLVLEEENVRLRRQIKTLEGEKENMKAFMEQRIELLEAQIESFKEREENTKKTNQTIMKILEEMNEKGSKNGLKLKAIEELEKSSQQYNQALLDLKTRMKEETGKLEMENKKLVESGREKDFEIRALKSFIKEIKNEYTGIKNLGSATKRDPVPQEDRNYIKERIQTMPDYITEKECPFRGGLDGRRETLRGYPFDDDGNMDSLRFFEQNSLFYKDEDLGVNLKGASQRQKIEYYWKELAKRKSRVENKDKLEELYHSMIQNLSPSQQLLLQEGQPMQSQKMPLSSIAESSNGSLTEPRLQKNNLFSLSTISLTSDFIKPGTNEHQVAPWDHTEKQGLNNAKIGLKEQLWSAAFLDFKRKSIEQAFCQPRNTEGYCAQDLSMSRNYDVQDKGIFKNMQKGSKVKKPSKYKRQSQTCFENVEDILRETKDVNREIAEVRRENAEQYSTKGGLEYEGEETASQRINPKDEEENIGAKSEIKFMIGRLLKVKNKLEKQSNVLNVSRSTQGWDQPLQAFSSALPLRESKNTDKYASAQYIDYNEKSTTRLAMTERKHQNSNIGSILGGKRDSLQPRKLVR